MIDSTPWAGRPRPGPPPVPLRLKGEDRARLEAEIRLPTVERRVLLRGQAVLLLEDDVAASDVAKVLGVHERTVFRWKVRFSSDKPLEKLKDAPRSGRPHSLSRKQSAPKS